MLFFPLLHFLLAAGTVALAAPSTNPVNGRSTTATRNLLSYLVRQSSNGNTLSGQQDLESAQWVAQNIGKPPAILDVDFTDYSPSRVAYGSSTQTVEDAISYSNAVGIIIFTGLLPDLDHPSISDDAHQALKSPSGTYNSDSQPWYRNFYAEATSFYVGNAMNNANSNDYKLLVRDIDDIASQLKRLQDTNIIVLWRPLHEAEGGWFWWGAKGPDACKNLYRLMYGRMTNYHGLNNLLWVWNSVDPSSYPGNDVVDIISADYYGTAGDDWSQINLYKSLGSLTWDAKVITLGEVGNIPDPVNTQKDGANWAYWMVWNGDLIKGTSYNPLQYKYNIFSSQYIATRDELGG